MKRNSGAFRYGEYDNPLKNFPIFEMIIKFMFYKLFIHILIDSYKIKNNFYLNKNLIKKIKFG